MIKDELEALWQELGMSSIVDSGDVRVDDGDDYYDADATTDQTIERVFGWMWNAYDFTAFDNLRVWCEDNELKALIWWEGEINMCGFSHPGWIH